MELKSKLVQVLHDKQTKSPSRVFQGPDQEIRLETLSDH